MRLSKLAVNGRRTRTDAPATATNGSRAATQVELHIVEKCRSVKSDAVWVQWLGYPKSRNCWRSASSHFPQLKGDDASLVLAARRRVQTTITAMAEEELEPELEGSGLVLIQGRQPINAREIRASSRWRRRASRTGLEAEAAAL